MKVYLLSKGSYSDYRVFGICSSCEKAEAVMRGMPGENYNGWNDIEEYELDAYVSKSEAGLRPFDVNRNEITGEWACKANHAYSSDGLDEFAKFDTRRWRRVGTDEYKYAEDKYFLSLVWAVDEQHALKVAGERRDQLIARKDL